MKKNIIEYNNEIFIETTFMGISVITDSNGYYQASKICKDNNKKFKRWMELEHTKNIILAYKDENLTENPWADINGLGENLQLIKYREINYQKFRGAYIHECLVHHLCEWCDLKYAITISKMIILTNKELHLRNITLEEKVKEMNNNLEKLTLEKEILSNENQLLKKRVVPEEESVRYLYILRTKTGYRLSGDSNTKFPSKSIYAKYQFSASMNYRKCFNSLCNNQYYHFKKSKLNEIIQRIQSYDPIVLINPDN